MKKLVLRSLLIRYHKDIPRTHDVHKRPNNGITTPHRRTRSISLLLQHIVPRFVTAQRARRLQRNRPLTSLPSEKRSYDFSMTIRRFPCAIVPRALSKARSKSLHRCRAILPSGMDCILPTNRFDNHLSQFTRGIIIYDAARMYNEKFVV